MATDPAGQELDQRSRFDQLSPFEALDWTDAPVKDGPVGPRHGLLGTRFAGVAATGGVLLAAGVAIGTVAVVAAAMLIGTGPAASTDPLDPVASGRQGPARQQAQRNGAALPGVAPAGPAAAVQPAGAVRPVPSVPPKLTGSFTVWSAGPQRDPCVDHRQVPDIKAGAPVVVSDAAGKVLATTALAQGRPESTKRGCVFAFSLAGLPSADTLAVKVGRQSTLTFPTAALANNGWRVTLNLGLPDQPAQNTG